MFQDDVYVFVLLLFLFVAVCMMDDGGLFSWTLNGFCIEFLRDNE